jgi:hypothetical protein
VNAAISPPSPSHALGSCAWADRTCGALTLSEQLSLMRQATLAQLSGLPSQLTAWLARGTGADSALLSGRRPPDSLFLACVLHDLALRVTRV